MKDLFGQEVLEEYGSEWAQDLVTVLSDGKEADLDTIYDRMEKLRKKNKRSWPKTANSTVRCTLQRHSREHEWFAGKEDLFQMVIPGVWQLKRRAK